QKPLTRRKHLPKEREFTKHFLPAKLFDDLCLHGEHAHFCVVRHLDKQWFRQYRKHESFTVDTIPGKKRELMHKSEKSRTLSDLKAWGWIQSERKKGSASRVFILWH